MTSDELLRLADQEESIPYQAEYRTCDYVIDAIREAADEIDRLNARIDELEQQVEELRRDAERYRRAVEAWIYNRPDDEQFTQRELAAFRTFERELELATIAIDAALKEQP